MFTKDEKKLLKMLVNKEMKEFKLEGKKVIDESPSEVRLEEEYEKFLKKIKDKL